MRAPIKKLPTQERLKELFDYDPETGVLLWRKRPETTKYNLGFNKKLAGKEAGTRLSGRDGNKYISICLGKGKYAMAHRIIWKMMTGDDPPNFIDHIDLDTFNNRWVNLREATNSTNKWNGKIYSNNTSGVKGVHWDSGHKKWRAVISANGKSIRLGRFATISEAACAMESERAMLHGQFARSR